MGMEGGHFNDVALTRRDLQDSLQEQGCALLEEIVAFQTFFADHKKENTIEIRRFKNGVTAELQSLQRHSSAARSGAEVLHSLHSSNLAYFLAVWAEAKKCEHLVALGRTFYLESPPQSKRRASIPPVDESQKHSNRPKCRARVVVDIVASEGQEWIKLSTITERRLGFEIAEKGWEADESPNEDPDSAAGSLDSDKPELLRLAKDLLKAAKRTRAKYQHPKITIALPNLTERKYPMIDRIVEDIRGMGITVRCNGVEIMPFKMPSVRMEAPMDRPLKGDHRKPEEQTSCSNQELEAIFCRLLPPPPRLTETLNVDCSLLLALISDLSNLRPSSIPASLSRYRAIQRQMDLEALEPLLSTHLWPAVQNRNLVCTTEAANKMKEIVGTMGTDSERQRMLLLLGEVSAAGLDHGGLVHRFQELSEYPIPGGWQLPIVMIDAQAIISTVSCAGKLPRVAEKVATKLTAVNRSVFLYGWATGYTTITSSRAVARMIEVTIEQEVGEDDLVEGPLIWVSEGSARSLVGKEKRLRPNNGSPELCASISA